MKNGVPSENAAIDLAVLLRLQAWLSPSFPVGAYSHSGGLEGAAEAAALARPGALLGWLESWLEDGPGWSDAVFLGAAHRATIAGDWERLAEIAELSAVFAPCRERRAETVAQGTAFLKAACAAAPWPDGAAQRAAIGALGAAPAYPTVFAAWTAGHGAPIRIVSALFLQAQAGNLISAAIRLGLTGQTEGQRLLAALAPLCARLSQEAASGDLEEIGGAMFRGDLFSMRHETQKVRLFRT